MKYELTNKTIKHLGKTLYQVKALKDFSNVSKGALGGYVESVDNLSQNGNAWVYGNARVYDDARVYGNAVVYGDARVYDNAMVFGDAEVFGNARVSIGSCTEKVTNLINLCQYSITAYNDYIRVGCKVFTKVEWLDLLQDKDLFLNECSDKKSQSKLHFYVTSLLQDIL